VRQLARSIRAHYRDTPLTVVGLMNGSLFFLVDLVRLLPPQTRIECWRVSSYRGKKSTGQLRGLDAVQGDYRGRQVLIVDDILDTGLTLGEVRRKLRSLRAADVRVCVLLDKNVPRKKNITADWTGFSIGNEFVLGYGLDLDHAYRTLPMIRAVDPAE
jgi:hypoxanthine phosphoribosyltransferase